MKAGHDEEVAIEMQGREADEIEWAALQAKWASDPAFAHVAADMAAAAAKAKLVA
jgi:hypothetical protein